jgi:hypothetical protein
MVWRRSISFAAIFSATATSSFIECPSCQYPLSDFLAQHGGAAELRAMAEPASMRLTNDAVS